MRSKRGFTLVELLVVIGIISILMSMLLPTLSKARQFARNLACQVNLRSIGQALQLYANDGNGKLPWAGIRSNADSWPGIVSSYMGADISETRESDGYYTMEGTYSPVLTCPESPQDVQTYNGHMDYTGNVRAFPNPTNNPAAQRSGQYPLAAKNGSVKMMLWDGGLFGEDGYEAAVHNVAQMGYWVCWSDYGGFTDPDITGWMPLGMVAHLGNDNPWSYTDIIPSSPNYVGRLNLDSPQGSGVHVWSCWTGASGVAAFQRYRHLGNTSCNFLFFDGHVEARKLGTVLIRDLSLYPR